MCLCISNIKCFLKLEVWKCQEQNSVTEIYCPLQKENIKIWAVFDILTKYNNFYRVLWFLAKKIHMYLHFYPFLWNLAIHITKIQGICVENDVAYLLMEYCASGCLYDYLQQNEESLKAKFWQDGLKKFGNWISQVAEAMAFLALNNIIHVSISSYWRLLLNPNSESLKFVP